jgi:hypothetical protein
MKFLSKASIQKAQNRPSTQLIESTSCVERSNSTIEAEDLSYCSSYQMLTTDKHWQNCKSPMKLIKKWTVVTLCSS